MTVMDRSFGWRVGVRALLMDCMPVPSPSRQWGPGRAHGPARSPELRVDVDEHLAAVLRRPGGRSSASSNSLEGKRWVSSAERSRRASRSMASSKRAGYSIEPRMVSSFISTMRKLVGTGS